MKKTILFMVITIMILSLASCGTPDPSQGGDNTSTTPDSDETSASESEIQEGSEPSESIGNSERNILIAYFSMPETTNPDNMTTNEDNSVVVIDGEVLGNTQYIAYLIQENTRGDIFRIEPKIPYPTDHNTLTDLAKEEQNNNARPELSASIENIDQYDVIFLGYPNWWADMPMILYTFLEEYDLSGKTIIPFNTHGGSGFSRTISTISDLEPDAEVITDGYTVSRDNVHSAEGDVVAWLKKLGY